MRSFLYLVLLFNQICNLLPKILYILIYLYFASFFLYAFSVLNWYSIIYSLKDPLHAFKFGYDYCVWWLENKTIVSLYYTFILFFSLSLPSIFIVLHKNIYYRYIFLGILQYLRIFVKGYILGVVGCSSIAQYKNKIQNVSFVAAHDTVKKIFNKKSVVVNKKNKKSKNNNSEIDKLKAELLEHKKHILQEQSEIEKNALLLEKSKIDLEHKINLQKKQKQEHMLDTYDKISQNIDDENK